MVLEAVGHNRGSPQDINRLFRIRTSQARVSVVGIILPIFFLTNPGRGDSGASIPMFAPPVGGAQTPQGGGQAIEPLFRKGISTLSP